jgi:hypothetical protein
MPYRDPDPSDPNVLVGVSLPGNREGLREMAATFAEEFARLGFDEERLLKLFCRPDYAAAHRAYRVLGEHEIRRIIREAVGVWGQFRVVVRESSPAPNQGPDRLTQKRSSADRRRAD